MALIVNTTRGSRLLEWVLCWCQMVFINLTVVCGILTHTPTDYIWLRRVYGSQTISGPQFVFWRENDTHSDDRKQHRTNINDECYAV